MSNFSALKKRSINSLQALQKEVEKMNDRSNQSEDSRYWSVTLDKLGNGSAVIRFLPPPDCDGDEALPWVRLFSHGFKGPTNKWYIENSLTTLNEKDPVTEYNSKLWAQSDDNSSWQRKQARVQKRKLHYISNIMVISDPKNPENNGKIFLFKYGKKIFDKMNAVMFPPEEEGPDARMNPFDLWTGADFKLRVRKVDGYPNYELSSFANPAPLSDDDDELEKIWKAEYSLKDEVDPSKFKSYKELQDRLNLVLGIDGEEDKPVKQERKIPDSNPSSKFNKQKTEDDGPSYETNDDDDDEDMKAFRRLAG